MGETVLVTGSSGFLGSYVARELVERGHRVIGLDLVEPRPEHAWVQEPARGGIELVLGGLEGWAPLVALMERYRPAAVVHNAAFVRLDLLAREPHKALRLNAEASVNVFEAARIFGVRRVVYLSSTGVLPRRQYEPIDAGHPIFTATESSPDTFYAAAKIASEAFAWAYHHSFGLDTLIIRPSAMYGFGMQWPMFIKPIVEDSLRGRPTRFETGGEFPRDYTHVKDVARLVRHCVEVPGGRVRDRCFYGATGRDPLTPIRVAEIVRELIPGADIEIGTGLTPLEQWDAATRGRYDISAAETQLGHTPRFADLRDGIADYIGDLRRYAESNEEDQ
jgi:nucleoside-diphosphate-sugar epimerase